ncbi:hypothetical protein WG922_03310 [Ramlibacter sp. AN1015]|uniref:hypothetical protein n=1 Tax=Ramlibacter sp. AN1015 TaxID=3133428 RepID=UPI0030BCE458
MGREESSSGAGEEAAPSFLEWAVAVLGLLTVLATLLLLGWEALRAEQGPPVPMFSVTRIEQQSPAQYLVRLEVRNTGPQTAASLFFSGELQQGEQVLERSTGMLDYLPPGATREAALVFSRDPRGLQLALRAEGWQRP